MEREFQEQYILLKRSQHFAVTASDCRKTSIDDKNGVGVAGA